MIELVVRVSSKHQITIPKDIAEEFRLQKGDILEIKRERNRIVMIPKEMILEDKYPIEDLEAADRLLSKGLPKEELSFKSEKSALSYLKKKIKL